MTKYDFILYHFKAFHVHRFRKQKKMFYVRCHAPIFESQNAFPLWCTHKSRTWSWWPLCLSSSFRGLFWQEEVLYYGHGKSCCVSLIAGITPEYSIPFSKQTLDLRVSASPPILRVKMLFSILQQMEQLFLPWGSPPQTLFQGNVGETWVEDEAGCYAWCQRKVLPFPVTPSSWLPSIPLDGATHVASSPAKAHSFQIIESFPLRDSLIKTFLFAFTLELPSELMFPSPSPLSCN